MSHPTRGEWIEIGGSPPASLARARLTPHGVSGLKFFRPVERFELGESHPTRGEWIEIAQRVGQRPRSGVSPHTG